MIVLAGVDKSGQLVSATRFAELTGVTRERLRTWERRHGFPAPVRVAGGPRRYALADVPRVVAVREAVASGVPIREALTRAVGAVVPVVDEVGAGAFRSAVERLPLPAALLSGPAPLRVEYVNAALRALPGAPSPGEEPARTTPEWGEAPTLRALHALFTRAADAVELQHRGWPGGVSARSVAYRVPVEPGHRPLIALVGLEAGGERAARRAAAEHELDAHRERERAERLDRWLAALARVADGFRTEPGPEALDRGTDALVRQLGAADGVVAAYASGQLVVPPSRRRLLRPTIVTVAAHPALGRAVRSGEPLWLDGAPASALGVPARLHAVAVPVQVAGEPLGVLLLLFDDVEEIGRDERRLLAAVSAALGFALLRDRLAQELREAEERRTRLVDPGVSA